MARLAVREVNAHLGLGHKACHKASCICNVVILKQDKLLSGWVGGIARTNVSAQLREW